ncbi:MAG: TolC family protein [Planctomycetota bacterium]|jgi:outer membrane protein TolC
MRSLGKLLLAGLLLAPAGCTPEQYAKQADKVAYGLLAAGQDVALGEPKAFDVIYQPLAVEKAPDGRDVIRLGEKVISIGVGPPTVLRLTECLEIAFRNSRSFQTNKEQLYSEALALANARRTWDWSLITGAVDADYSLVRVAGTSTDKSSTALADLTLIQRFVHGGVLVFGASLDFATDFLGSDSTLVGSLLEANFTQPLLRGAWRELAYEDQYRLERDFLFAVYEYERFTQTFASGIVRSYYSVLKRRDELANEQANIERLKETLALTRVLAEGGQISRIQENQAEQDLLNAQVRYESSLQSPPT